MTPVPAPATPLSRALDEALASVAAPAQARIILRSALLRADIEAPPSDPQALADFVDVALLACIEQSLGRDAAELVGQQLDQVLRMIAPAISRRATGTSDTDDASGERQVEAVASVAHPKTSDVRPPVRPRADIAAALRPPPRSEMSTPDELRPLEAPVLFTSTARTNESGMQRKGTAVARVTAPGTSDPSRPAVVETRGPLSRTLPAEVLVVTLDEQLALDVEASVQTRAKVLLVAGLDALVRALVSGTARHVVIIDATLPSIDVPTLARHAAAFPPNARVWLLGADERARARLQAHFPDTARWLVSADLPSADTLIEP